MKFRLDRPIAAVMSLTVLAACLSARAQPAPASPPALTNASQIRSLRRDEAARHVPIHVTGVVIEAGGGAINIRDDTAGVYIQAPATVAARFNPGDLIDVTGASDPGEFAPVVVAKNVRKIGTREIPSPRPVTFEELAAGVLDSQWVEISGVVRYVETPSTNAAKFRLEMAVGGGRLTVRVNLPRSE